MPGLRAVMAGSSQRVIWPRKMAGEHRAGQVQPGARREVEVVGDAFGGQRVGHLGDGASFGGC